MRDDITQRLKTNDNWTAFLRFGAGIYLCYRLYRLAGRLIDKFLPPE